jgi:hypothetical protein
MAENLSNDYSSTLAGAINSSVTNFSVASTTGAPAAEFRIRIDNELILVTGVSSPVFSVTRGIEGTTAASHADGATVSHVMTKGGLDQYITERYLPKAGGTMTGKVTTVASATGGAGLTLPHGTAPTSPVNGDMWTTTAGAYARINGATVGLGASFPLTAGNSGTKTAPQYAFDADTGVFSDADNSVSLTAGDTEMLRARASKVRLGNWFSTTADAYGGPVSADVMITRDGAGGANRGAGLLLGSFNSTVSWAGAYLNLYRCRTSTGYNGNGSLSSGDNIGIIAFGCPGAWAADGNTTGAEIRAIADSAHAYNSVPTRIEFANCPSGGYSPVVRMTIQPAGHVDHSGVSRVTGTTSMPASGAGLELEYNASVGNVQTYNRGTSSWGALALKGSTVDISPSGTSVTQFTSTGQSLGGNLTLTGTGRRLIADMSNGTADNRFSIQTSTTNNPTYLQILTNGTSLTTQLSCLNANNATNAGLFSHGCDNAKAYLNTHKYGSGSTLPLEFQVDGVAKWTLSTAGALTSSVGYLTYTPTVTASGGTLTTVSASSAYTKIGRTIHWNFTITITTNGTGSGNLRITLPVAATGVACGAGREITSTGHSFLVQLDSVNSRADLFKYDNSYIGGDGRVYYGSLTYEAAS